MKNLNLSLVILYLITLTACSARMDSNSSNEITPLRFFEGDEPRSASDELQKSMEKDDDNFSGDEDKKQDTGGADVKTWKRSQKRANAAKLFVGGQDTLPLKGMQVLVKVDGFRARVLIDGYYYNDQGSQLEGTFKLRLPNGASPYFFAFGETVYLNEEEQKLPFLEYKNLTAEELSPEAIMSMHAETWTQPKEAVIVSKEKAAFAYTQTVSRRVDPALMEWAGADVFNCRVFPLMPEKLHRVVFGYDVDLTTVANNQLFNFPIPETEVPLVVDLDVAHLGDQKPAIKPTIKTTDKNQRSFAHLENPTMDEIEVVYHHTGGILLNQKASNDSYWAAHITPKFPQTSQNAVAPDALFVLDASLSSNPDKFNIWIKLLESTLAKNEGTIKNFAVLCFNIETFWWKNSWSANTASNRKALMDFANNIALEGSTDIGNALQTVKTATWAQQAKTIFLLSDGSITWGEDDEFMLSNLIDKNDRLFAYKTGMSGTNNNTLGRLAQGSGGAVFSVVNEDQVTKASQAFRNQAFRLVSAKLDNGSDILLAGRPSHLYADQALTVVGRGAPKKGSSITLTLSLNGKETVVKTQLKSSIQSDLAMRTYGLVATTQLEEFGFATEKYSKAYATHFRIPGKTCSFLMLESEEDYAEYNIKPEEDAFAVKSNPASTIIKETLANMGDLLGNAKAAFESWINKLTKTAGVEFELSLALESILKRTPKSSFEISPKAFNCKVHNKNQQAQPLQTTLNKKELDYETVSSYAVSRLAKHGKTDALKLLSSLVERNPKDGVLARDVAFSAMEYQLPEQAYHLLKRVVQMRPYEPQTYHAIARVLTDMNKIDLAVLYYEIAISAKWLPRFGEFNMIAGLDYVYLLKQIQKGTYKVSFPDYVEQRLQTLEKDLNIDNTDLVITIMWNTDQTDIDLHVYEPSGAHCYYEKKTTKSGGRMTQDVTQGYGPEMFIHGSAPKGKYKIKAKYYSNNSSRTSAPTKVYATIYKNRGKANESVVRKVVELKGNKDIEDILTVGVE
ncbi:MAG: VWA domain-containing protein [Aureispira sp.]|nr:VWA domain-containing protein [Aureispira sp.]